MYRYTNAETTLILNRIIDDNYFYSTFHFSGFEKLFLLMKLSHKSLNLQKREKLEA